MSDALGREDPGAVRRITATVFQYAIVLGVLLGGLLFVGDRTEFLEGLFTRDEPTRDALRPLLGLLVVAQPLNAAVFAADGVLQGAGEFGYQAKAMVLSVGVAVLGFIGLERYGVGTGDTLVHVWEGLLVLQLARGVTSLVKLVDKKGPIDLFGN